MITFDNTEAELREAEKARRRMRYERRLGAVHQRRNTKNRPQEARNGNTKRAYAARREATDRSNW